MLRHLDRRTHMSDIEERLQPNFKRLVQEHLRRQLGVLEQGLDFDVEDYEVPITTYNSAVAKFYAPSDLSGMHGMRRERIRAVPKWRNGLGRYDTMLIQHSGARTVLSGFTIGRVRLFFSYIYSGERHTCALVHDWEVVGEEPDPDTGFWVVRRSYSGSRPHARVISLNDILRAVHLIPVYKEHRHSIDRTLHFSGTLDNRDFRRFYVNHYIDHHAFEILSSTQM